jgi:hypothetical protein
VNPDHSMQWKAKSQQPLTKTRQVRVFSCLF